MTDDLGWESSFYFFGQLDRRIVMYTVLSSLAACGCLGVAEAAAGVFVCHA